ncbi:MAG: heparinase II/III family protein [Sandaracinaceae bacterium]|nr:heparinase II/III family protein [Sandaracinaceae bacterium]
MRRGDRGRRGVRGATATATALALLFACDGASAPDAGTPSVDAGGVARAPRAPITHPSLLFRPEDRDAIRARVAREPYAGVLAALRERAALPLRAREERWDHRVYGHNGCVAQANAVLAWLEDDADAAARAREILLALEPDVDTDDTWDLNIRMPAPLMCHVNAWDLLQATGTLSADEARAAGEVLTSINEAFYARYVLDRATRQIALGFSQNNHPIRTAAAIGYVALAFPAHPSSDAWLDWALSELDYLLGENGQYLQPDGAVSEGPAYFGFAAEAAVAFLHTYERLGLERHEHRRDCVNRQRVDPWQGHGCVPGEAFTFPGMLARPLFQSAFDWSIAIRLPSGQRPPLADARLTTPGHAALLTAHGAPPHFLWDWAQNERDPRKMDAPIVPLYLLMLDDARAPSEPPYRNRFFEAGGNAVLRSGWDTDARWLLLVAEHGAARRTLHDHVDGTSFTLAAYGDYLLMDTGYYKPLGLDNARTAHAPSHNVILIDGEGAPDKGLLNDWGDADAFLEHATDGDALAWVEARQTYRETTIVRGVAFVRRRYFVVADRLATDHASAREHRLRLHAHAGLDLGHTFALGAELHVARERGGARVFTASTDGAVRWEEPPFTPEVAPHVHELQSGAHAHHGVADAVVTARAPSFLSVLAPYRVGASEGDDAPLVVTALEAGAGAVAWLVEGAGFADVVWLRGEGAASELALPGGRRVTTDAAVVIVALDGAFGLVARGAFAALDGADAVRGEGPVVLRDAARP